MKFRKLFAFLLAGALFVGYGQTAQAAFDPVFYAQNNPDVVAALGNDAAALQMHYEVCGKQEGRMGSASDVYTLLTGRFNPQDYAALYPDLQAAFGTDPKLLLAHYTGFGFLEGRRPSNGVSQEQANQIKAQVEQALSAAGITAVPGSPEMLAFMQANATNAGNTATPGTPGLRPGAERYEIAMPALAPAKSAKKTVLSPYKVSSMDVQVVPVITGIPEGAKAVVWYGNYYDGTKTTLADLVKNGKAWELEATRMDVDRCDLAVGFSKIYDKASISGMKVPMNACTVVVAVYEGESLIPSYISWVDFAFDLSGIK